MSANLFKGVNSSHTPGPWIVSHDPDACSDDDYCIGVPDGKVDQVAVCSKRDAAIIAAAPDMYEALKAASQFIRNGIEYGYIQMPDRDTPDSAHDTLPMIDASLAKAVAK